VPQACLCEPCAESPKQRASSAVKRIENRNPALNGWSRIQFRWRFYFVEHLMDSEVGAVALRSFLDEALRFSHSVEVTAP
jgi:hypothetical protein